MGIMVRLQARDTGKQFLEIPLPSWPCSGVGNDGKHQEKGEEVSLGRAWKHGRWGLHLKSSTIGTPLAIRAIPSLQFYSGVITVATVTQTGQTTT